MPPAAAKRRRAGAKAPPNRWTRAELDVLLGCLSNEEFLSKHAKTLEPRQFPTYTLREACVKDNEYHGVCVAIAQEILSQQGQHNNFNLRPFASIASKILDMTGKARASNPGLSGTELFDAFDVDAFMTASTSAGPEPAAAAEPESAAGKSADAAPPEDADKETAKEEEEEYDDTYVAPVRDPNNITFQTRILNPHLVCTLCMGYFNDACTIIECLHTFCRACIMRHFKESHQVCPTCDSHLGTNPRDLVRTDRTLQSIVDKVFPQFAAQTASSSAAKRPASPPGRSPRPAKAGRPSAAPSQAAAEEAPEEISFSLQEVETEASASAARLEKPYLRTSARLTVSHLKKYLAKKMRTTAATSIEIMCRDEPLPLEISLDAIVRSHWRDATEDLVLTYRLVSGDAEADAAAGGGDCACTRAPPSAAPSPCTQRRRRGAACAHCAAAPTGGPPRRVASHLGALGHPGGAEAADQGGEPADTPGVASASGAGEADAANGSQ